MSIPLEQRRHDRPCYVGAKSGARSLLIPIDGQERDPETDLGDHVRAGRQSLGLGEHSGLWYVLSTDRVALFARFTDLSHALLNALDSGLSLAAAVDKTVKEYRQLLWPTRRLLTLRELAGIAGELEVLATLVRDDLSVDCWKGPAGAAQDFRPTPSQAIEAKATGFVRDESVHISSLQQLDASQFGELFLAVIEMVEDFGGTSLTAMCERVMDSGADQFQFERSLRMLGIDDWRTEPFSTTRFRIGGVAWFHVSPTFPAIAPAKFIDGHLPAGVTAGSYSLNVAALSEWRVSQDEVLTAIQRGVPGATSE